MALVATAPTEHTCEYGLFTLFLWFLYAILAKWVLVVPASPRTHTAHTTTSSVRHSHAHHAAVTPSPQVPPRSPPASPARTASKPRRTEALHVLACGVAEHLRRRGRARELAQVHHELHVLVHGVGAVEELGTEAALLHLLEACVR